MTRFVSIWAELLIVAPGKFTALPVRSARSRAQVEKWKVGEGRVYNAAHSSLGLSGGRSCGVGSGGWVSSRRGAGGGRHRVIYGHVHRATNQFEVWPVTR